MTVRDLSGLDGLGSDWSGVVSDDRKPVHLANMRVLECRGITPLTLDEWLPKTTLTPREFFRNQGITEDEEMLFDEYRRNYGALVAEGIRPVPYTDARPFWEHLVGIELRPDVISSHPTDHLQAEAREYGIYPYVGRFVGSVKDKGQEIWRLISRRDINPQRYAYVGDTVYDIHAARAAGVIAIAVATGYHTRERLAKAEPDVLVDSLTELMHLIAA